MAATTQIALITLVTLFSLLFLSGMCSATTLSMSNECSYPVWPAILSDAGSSIGFALQPGESKALTVPLGWSGHLWARTSCSKDINGSFSCITGNCGSSMAVCTRNATLPVTLAEFSLNGTGGVDLFDVSVVEGFNIPMKVEAVGGKCRARGCVLDLNVDCPAQLRVIRYGEAVACTSICEGQPCLSSQFFKNACPAARVDVYDPSTFCASADYNIIFCSTTSWTMAGKGKHLEVPLVMIIAIVVIVVFLLLLALSVAYLCGRTTSETPRRDVFVFQQNGVGTTRTDRQPESYLSRVVSLVAEGFFILFPWLNPSSRSNQGREKR